MGPDCSIPCGCPTQTSGISFTCLVGEPISPAPVASFCLKPQPATFSRELSIDISYRKCLEINPPQQPMANHWLGWEYRRLHVCLKAGPTAIQFTLQISPPDWAELRFCPKPHSCAASFPILFPSLPFGFPKGTPSINYKHTHSLLRPWF